MKKLTSIKLFEKNGLKLIKLFLIHSKLIQSN